MIHARQAPAGRNGPPDDRRRIEVEAARRAIDNVERLEPGITTGRPPRDHFY